MDHRKPNPPCIFPSADEIDLGTLQRTSDTTALRVRVDPGGATEGYVRLEQLAWSDDLGWYCQKSFIVPGPLVRELVTHLRKADCFLPRTPAGRAAEPFAPLPLRLTEPIPHDEPEQAQRRDA